MMLFLLVLSLLAFSVLNITLLENKMCVFYQNKIKSFYIAEKNLLQAEKKILAGAVVVDNNIRVIDSSVCGVIFYRLTASASFKGAKTSLQSTFAKLGDDRRCDSKPSVTPGRQSFLVEF